MLNIITRENMMIIRSSQRLRTLATPKLENAGGWHTTEQNTTQTCGGRRHAHLQTPQHLLQLHLCLWGETLLDP